MPGGAGSYRTVATERSWTGGQYSFAQVPQANIPRAVFNRSHGVRQTFDSGYLVPIFVDEALPGDTMSMRVTTFTRMSTPIFPVMDNIYQEFFFFAVPMRLVWEHTEEFFGESPTAGAPTVEYTIPQFELVTVTQGSLSDYLGVPPGANRTFNSLWHRAYNLCWREWFRAQDLQDSPVVDMDDGPDTLTDYVLLRRGKRHDYFTAALPYTQKGDPVTLPLGTSAPVAGATTDMAVVGTGDPTFSVGGVTPLTMGTLGGGGGGSQVMQWSAAIAAADAAATWVTPNLEVTAAALNAAGLTADLSAAVSATVNEWRQAVAIQQLLERQARSGSRYTEVVRASFGVVSPDQRLQRPEYLGGGSTRINMHPVARTNVASGSAAQAAGPPQATLGAFATASGMVGWSKSFTEHTLLIGMVQVRADLTYQQGLEKMFSRQFRFDYYWPEFAMLGEQPILNQEIYYQGVAGTGPTQDQGVFGYQERWAEYRYKPSRTAGRFRSQDATPVDQWHLGIEFGALPVLNASFIVDDSPFSRVIAVTTEPQFYGDFWFEYKCARPMPMFSVPGLARL